MTDSLIDFSGIDKKTAHVSRFFIHNQKGEDGNALYADLLANSTEPTYLACKP